MNIQTAAGYAEHGYRLRRTSWPPKSLIGKKEKLYWFVYYIESEGRSLSVSCTWWPSADDLLADDWVLILDGIATDYGTVKYEAKL